MKSLIGENETRRKTEGEISFAFYLSAEGLIRTFASDATNLMTLSFFNLSDYCYDVIDILDDILKTFQWSCCQGIWDVWWEEEEEEEEKKRSKDVVLHLESFCLSGKLRRKRKGYWEREREKEREWVSEREREREGGRERGGKMIGRKVETEEKRRGGGGGESKEKNEERIEKKKEKEENKQTKKMRERKEEEGR